MHSREHGRDPGFLSKGIPVPFWAQKKGTGKRNMQNYENGRNWVAHGGCYSWTTPAYCFSTYLLHFTLNSTMHALALKPKPLVVRSTDRGRDPGSLKNGIVRRDYGIVRRDALALKPKPLVVHSREHGRDPGLLKKWHRLPRLSALVTDSEVTAQSLPCTFFAPSLIPNDKDFIFV